ncbi:protein-tyrosine-phosphatase [Malassezia nana]|uniref:protein-tyrosine-phosphatase n=1 Tax=Malassezia nana TaxID=180528 RepID=A0AAF0EUB4_9BASI|nr:protein-tyrosine-phosphatase [Malassezia nana]
MPLPNIKAPAPQTVAPPPDRDLYLMVTPEFLHNLLHMRAPDKYNKPEHVLVLDIRPPTSFLRCHIKGSVNVCAPTTLLRRPEFTIDKIEEQILINPNNEKFRDWRLYTKGEAPQSWIVVLDTDSTKTTSVGRSSAGGGGASLLGLLRKFLGAGYQGHLCWLTGGFLSYTRWAPAADDIEWAQQGQNPMSALPSMLEKANTRPLNLHISSHNPALALSGTMAPSAMQPTNPFFNNIRQNLELSCGITDVVPLDIAFSDADLARLPRFLRDLAVMEPRARAQHLAEKFFEIEKKEQSRLQSVMQRHAFESSTNQSANPPEVLISSRAAYPWTPTEHTIPPDAFLLSITAAIERGNDHRYRNFWTFEHSRVKLEHQPNRSRYINASFINPLRYMGGHGVYIATQAPLPSTFSVFLSVLWEYNVQTIVMLAREEEAGRVKCDNYWDELTADPFHVSVVEQKMYSSEQLQDFNKHVEQKNTSTDTVVIHRTLKICNRAEPNAQPRYIAHYQYVAWPDHSVPESPLDLLGLNKLVHESEPASSLSLIHCSAGIGRTGAYIIVDAVSSFLQQVRSSLSSKAEPSITPCHLQCWESPTDLIYEATMIIREQRMSMIETVRQYVFVYKAVMLALLADPVP